MLCDKIYESFLYHTQTTHMRSIQISVFETFVGNTFEMFTNTNLSKRVIIDKIGPMTMNQGTKCKTIFKTAKNN